MGPRIFHTRKRRSAVIALAEPASEYLLRDPDAFESGKEARSFLFTEKYLQAMLTDASHDNTLAQAARVAAAAAAAIAPKAYNPRRFRFPPEQTVASFHQTPRFDDIQVSRDGRGGRGRRSGRSRSQRHSAWLQGGRRYAYLNPDPLPSRKDYSKPRSKSVSKPESMFHPSLYGKTTAPMGVASRLKNFASHWTSVTDDL